jgi:hypothetical protein
MTGKRLTLTVIAAIVALAGLLAIAAIATAQEPLPTNEVRPIATDTANPATPDPDAPVSSDDVDQVKPADGAIGEDPGVPGDPAIAEAERRQPAEGTAVAGEGSAGSDSDVILDAVPINAPAEDGDEANGTDDDRIFIAHGSDSAEATSAEASDDDGGKNVALWAAIGLGAVVVFVGGVVGGRIVLKRR